MTYKRKVKRDSSDFTFMKGRFVLELIFPARVAIILSQTRYIQNMQETCRHYWRAKGTHICP